MVSAIWFSVAALVSATPAHSSREDRAAPRLRRNTSRAVPRHAVASASARLLRAALVAASCPAARSQVAARLRAASSLICETQVHMLSMLVPVRDHHHSVVPPHTRALYQGSVDLPSKRAPWTLTRGLGRSWFPRSRTDCVWS